jgi:deoxycytidylate deaminase
MSHGLPKIVVTKAREVALMSPCAKSKRGVVIFHPSGNIVAMGCNRPPRIGWPPQLHGVEQTMRARECDGSAACRESCAKRCIHAESTAVRTLVYSFAQTMLEMRVTDQRRQRAMLGEFELVHVKIGADGDLVAGGGPSCWQCSREILDVGIGFVWLYLTGEAAAEAAGEIGSDAAPTWMRYSAIDFDEISRKACGVY